MIVDVDILGAVGGIRKLSTGTAPMDEVHPWN
jgi:hypothetical protein